MSPRTMVPARDRTGSRSWPPTRRTSSSRNRTTLRKRPRRSPCPARSKAASRRRAIATTSPSTVRKTSGWCFVGRRAASARPATLFLRIYNAEGGVLAEAEDDGAAEGAINFTFPADGTVSAARRGYEPPRRPRPRVSRRSVEPYEPGFTLVGRGRKGRRAAKRRVRRQGHRRAARLQRPHHALRRRRGEGCYRAPQHHSRGQARDDACT